MKVLQSAGVLARIERGRRQSKMESPIKGKLGRATRLGHRRTQNKTAS